MKPLAHEIKNEQGFSLIELMVVVAIIGVLATMAVPNFNRLQAKAKQAEAKANLSAIYSAQKAFYAEWSTYYGVFADIGYVPEGRMNYVIATGSGTGKLPTGGYTPASGVGSGTDCFSTVGSCSLNISKSAAANGATLPSLSDPSTDGFKAGAAAMLTTADQWTMDQNRTLSNSLVGI